MSTVPAVPPRPASEYIVYAGTYSAGVYGFRYESETGRLQPLGLQGKVQSPSFLALHPHQGVLYAVSELEGDKEGSVAAFAIDPKTATLTPLNLQSSAGVAPCHLTSDPAGKLLLVANYVRGGMTAFPIAEDGSLEPKSFQDAFSGTGPNKERQEGPHAHEAVFSTDGSKAYVPDLGTDRIHVFSARDGKLAAEAPIQLPPGTGPRHMVFSHDERFLYLFGELKSDVTVFERRGNGFEAMQTVHSLPNGKEQDGGAEIAIDQGGHHLYTSNRDVGGKGSGSLTVFDIDGASGKLKVAQNIKTGGHMPRAMVIDPSGQFMLVGDQKSNEIETFHIAESTGLLTPSGTRYPVPSPVSFVFVPAR